MTKQKIEDSPLARKRLMIGAAQPEPEHEPEPTDIQTSKHKGTTTGSGGTDKVRTTIYVPADLMVRLKIYLARHRGEDASKIITRLLEELLDREE